MKFLKIKVIGVIIILAIIAVAVFVLTGGGSDKGNTGQASYKEYTVERGTFRIMVSANGLVEPINRVEVKSKASGRVEELPVDEGDLVRKGELIVRLDQTDVRASLEQAQADLDIAEAELKQAENTFRRREQLFEKGLISQEELDNTSLALAQAKGKIIRARTSLDQAQVNFDETIVLAPNSGIILQKYVEVGQIIASGVSNVGGGTTIVDIADMERVYITAGIDEIDVGKVGIGQAAVVMAEAYADKKFRGHIVRIAPEARVDQNVTLFDVVIEVENLNGMLKSGMNATVEITIVEKNDILLAPALALKTNGDNKSGATRAGAFGPGPGGPEGEMAVNERRRPDTARFHAADRERQNIRIAQVKTENGFEPREVVIGLSDFDKTEIISGLKEGDIIGVPMTSRLKAENDQMEERIKSMRSFGTSSSSGTTGGGGGGGRP